MSKMDELRALREARYERAVARAAAKPEGAPESAGSAKPPATEPEAKLLAADHQVKLCGHRAISGRACTREHGHAAKSHRYS